MLPAALQVNSCPGSEAGRLKAAGNDAFRARDWATAVRLYRCSNCAAALLVLPASMMSMIDSQQHVGACPEHALTNAEHEQSTETHTQ